MFEYIALTIIIFVAAFSKALSGFSFALIAMGFLPNFFPLNTVVTLVSILQLLTTYVLIFIYRKQIKLKLVGRLIFGSIVGVPLGVFFLKNIDTTITLKFLGFAIIIYCLYNFFFPRTHQFIFPQWGYLFGLISGILSGAYNLSGPPIIIYGNSSPWNMEEFKSNILTTFAITETITVINRLFSGNVTPAVIQLFQISILPLALGMLSGLWLSSFLNPVVFKRIILIMLIFSGIKLIW